MECGLRLAGSSDVEFDILVAVTKALWRQDVMARLASLVPVYSSHQSRSQVTCKSRRDLSGYAVTCSFVL